MIRSKRKISEPDIVDEAPVFRPLHSFTLRGYNTMVYPIYSAVNYFYFPWVPRLVRKHTPFLHAIYR